MSLHALNILIIDETHPILIDMLASHNISYQPNISLNELKHELGNCDVLIMRSKLNFNSEWIDRAPKLKYIGRLGSGMDNIDVAYASKKGIKCLNAPEGNRNAVAEQGIGMLLSILSNIHKSSLELKEGEWNRHSNSGRELSNMTVGIIGYGNVGTALAKKLRGFGCRILAYDLYKSSYADSDIEEVTLAELQDQAEIVSLHVPLNKFSYKMINKQFVDRMSKPFYLLNLSRGDVVDTECLISGLKEEKILGLALDVFENETISKFTDSQRDMFNYLQSNPNVIMTPHIAGLTSESFVMIAKVLAQKLIEEIK
jgi:D-3-phosphoglycerate dehydrogenase